MSSTLQPQKPGPKIHRTRRLLGLAMLCWATAWPAIGQAQTPDAQVVWGQDVFMIPYRWSGSRDRSAVKEVVLYVSQNHGQSWNEVTRARPNVQSFMYRAAGDGSYAFAIRTIDSAGVAWPNGSLTPELQVVVDTVLPVLQIKQSELSSDGQLRIVVQATDPQLDQQSLSAAYRDPTTRQWLPFNATPRSEGPQTAILEATVQLPPEVQRVDLRATVKDRAGNPATAGASAQAAWDHRQSRVPYPSTGATMVPADPFTTSTAFNPLAQLPPAPARPAATLPPAPTHSPWQSPAPGAQVWQPDNQPSPQVAARSTLEPTTQPATSAYRFASNSSSASLPQATTQTATPDRLLVNASRFELQYDLQSVGRWGVEEVEVWGTQDGGQSWRSFAVDTDQRSPVDIQVPGDGLYGFTIVVQSVGGLQKRPPQSGDRPDVLVEVDQVRPQTRLTSAAQPDGYFADHLVFGWSVEDTNLVERPISLMYATRPSGPWQPIASNLENNGRYSWRLQRHVPSQVYIRLEARDRAGNLGVDQSDSPIAIHLPESTGTIRTVRPLE